MNWQFIQLYFITTLALFGCDKLSKEENENRLKMCGNVQSKIFNAQQVPQTSSPWTVFLLVQGPNSSTCTGALISPRHVLTASHCVSQFEKVPHGTTFTSVGMSGKKIEKKDCTGEDYIIDDPDVAKNVHVTLGDKIDYKNPGIPYNHGKKVWMLSACRVYETNEAVIDMTLIEMEKEFPMDSGWKMACVSDSLDDVAAGVTLDFYGFGSRPENRTNLQMTDEHVLQHERSFIFNPSFVFRSPGPKTGKGSDEELIRTRSVTETTVACAGDSGGGATRIIDGRTTVVAVISQTSCASITRYHSSAELFTAVALRSDKICEYGGICPSDSKPKVF